MRATANQFFDGTGEPIDQLEAFPEDLPDLPFLASALAGEAEAALVLPGASASPASAPRRREDGEDLPHLRRALDCVASLVLLVLLLPVMLLVMAAISLSGDGPVLFAHRRLGRGGQPFDCLKFRTMHCGAEAGLPAVLAAHPELEREWAQTQKLLEDPRVTPIGRFLRNTSLDELPQLLNVLAGDMALVGPRPIIADELERYGRHAATYLKVKPGLTGLWQITRDAETSYRRRVATDVLYVRRRSLAFDLRIVLATVPAVLFGSGTR
jgi:lipopolysaccharide/colanic/teichoic acid biosynthesis glycosyltransferase